MIAQWTEQVVSSLLPVVVDVAVKGAVLLAIAAATTLAMRRASAAARQLVWCFAMAGLLILPVLTTALPAWRVLPKWIAAAPLAQVPVDIQEPPPAASHYEPAVTAPIVTPPASQDIKSAVTTAPPPASDTPVTPAPADMHEPTSVTPAAAAVAPSESAKTPQGRNWISIAAAWAMVAWGVGVVVCLIPVVLSHLALRRLERRASRVADAERLAFLEQAKRLVGLRRKVILLESRERTMPMLWGLRVAKLLVPAEFAQWSPQRQRAVLLHELAHARRCDGVMKMMALVACSVYWFNPLAWLALKQLQAEAEQGCDDLVLSTGHRASDYAEDLLHIASGLNSGALAAYSSIAMARKSKLEGRLLAILDGKRNRRALTRWGVLVAAVLIAAIAIPLACISASKAPKPATQAATQPIVDSKASWQKIPVRVGDQTFEVEIQRFDPPREIKPVELGKASRSTPMDTAVSMDSIIAHGSTEDDFRRYAEHFEDPAGFMESIRRGAGLTWREWFPKARQSELGMRAMGLIRYKQYTLIVVSKERQRASDGKSYQWIGAMCMFERDGKWLLAETAGLTEPVIKQIHETNFAILQAAPATQPATAPAAVDILYHQQKIAMPQIVRRLQALEKDYDVLEGISAVQTTHFGNSGGESVYWRVLFSFRRNLKRTPKATTPYMIADPSKGYCDLTVDLWERHWKEEKSPAGHHHGEGSFGLDTRIYTSDEKLKKAFEDIVREELAKAEVWLTQRYIPTTATLPVGSRLEFRVAPDQSDIDKAELEKFKESLKAGRVGFWWKGTAAERELGRIPQYVWLPIAEKDYDLSYLATEDYKGQKYLLVSNRPGQFMAAGEGKDAWGLTRASADKGGSGKPLVQVEMDDRGGQLFTALTKDNLKLCLAVIVDGKVLSVPRIMAVIGKQCDITGQFTQQQAEDLARSLKAGMPPLKSPAPSTPSTGSGPSPSTGSRPSTQPATAPTSQGTGDQTLTELAAEVRAQHPAGGLEMWKALGKLVNPGMTVRQMKLLLPPWPKVVDATHIKYVGWIDWSGNFFHMEYWLDSHTKLTVTGHGETRAGRKSTTTVSDYLDEDEMILGESPTIAAARATPSAGSGPSTQPATPWGKPAGGLRVRLRAETSSWTEGKVPVFVLDIENLGTKPARYSHFAPNECHLNIDGKHYENSSLSDAAFKDLPLVAKEKAIPVMSIVLDKRLWSGLNLSVGRHTIQAEFKEVSTLEHPLSNVIEFDILPPTTQPATRPTTAPTSQGTGDQTLTELAANVRAQHPAGGLEMWQALAKLVKPGMTVRQMKLVMPPKKHVLVAFSGSSFSIRYDLDDVFDVLAGGPHSVPDSVAGDEFIPGNDDQILHVAPWIENRSTGPHAIPAPATKPVPSTSSGPSTQPKVEMRPGEMWWIQQPHDLDDIYEHSVSLRDRSWEPAALYASKRTEWNQPAKFAIDDPRVVPNLDRPVLVNNTGVEKLGASTRVTRGYIVIDGHIVSAPVIRTPAGNQGVSTGFFTHQEAEDLARAAKAGTPQPKSPAPSTPSTGSGPSPSTGSRPSTQPAVK